MSKQEVRTLITLTYMIWLNTAFNLMGVKHEARLTLVHVMHIYNLNALLSSAGIRCIAFCMPGNMYGLGGILLVPCSTCLA
jgi:hypothetical protein